MTKSKISVIVFLCILLGFTIVYFNSNSASNKLKEKLQACQSFDSTIFEVVKFGIKKFGEIQELSKSKIDELCAENKINYSCLANFKIKSIQFVYSDGVCSGALIYLTDADDLIVYLTFDVYRLSKRYSKQVKVSDRLYVVKYFG